MTPTPIENKSSLDSAECASPEVSPVAAVGKYSYGQILKSSAIIGGSSVVNIAIGIMRTKALAIFLGPAGVGFMGLYGSILNLAQSIADMGINGSGVRQIAEAAGSGEPERIARTAIVLRRTAMLLGVLGAVLLILFAKQISILTFGNDQHTTAIAALSLALFFLSVSSGQGALIHGMRRIADLAKMGMLGAFFGTVISVALIYWFRERGIVPSLICVAASTVVTSWWFSRKVSVQSQRLTLAAWRRETGTLLKLGLAFNVSWVLTMAAAYAIRLIVLREVSVEAAGLYQSAWTLGGLYVGFILQSMGADFYPRLTAIAKDNAECNRLVNEQAEVSLLLAGPGVIATVTFAPLVIALFYTTRFTAAVEPLRWICLGMALRVIAWPMGFVILAKGVQSILIWTELAATIVHVGLAFVFVRYFGLVGATMAFFGLYIWHGILIYAVVRRLSGFRWSPANLRTGLLFLPVIGMVFCAFHWLPFWIATGTGTVAAFAAGIYSIKRLMRLVALDRVPRFLRQLLVALRLAPAGSI